MEMPKWIGAAGAAAAALEIVNTPASQLKSIELITGEQLNQCTSTLSARRCENMAALINKLFPQYGITTKDVLHEPLANFLQESMEFNMKVEDMSYRAVTIHKVWPKRFPTIADAQPFARNPKKLANFTYGGRMGNRPGTDDGFNLRGSGFVGLTGRYVLTEYAKFKGFKTPEEAAEYARSSDFGALDSALWFFCVLKDLMDEAEKDDFIGIVKEINGGTIGIHDRLHYYDLVKKYVV